MCYFESERKYTTALSHIVQSHLTHVQTAQVFALDVPATERKLKRKLTSKQKGARKRITPEAS
jgi:hypothetical protein